MKVIPLSEAKAKLSRYGRLCHDEPIVVTVNGKPSFQLVPLNEDEDLIDLLLTDHAGFREMLEKRLSEPSVSPTTAIRRLKSNSRPARRA
jgi:prevent-host-death family protein